MIRKRDKKRNPAESSSKQRRMWGLPLLLSTLLIVMFGQAAFAQPIHDNGVVQNPYKSAAAERTPLLKKTAYGIYEGLADGHTVEISVYGEAIALQFKQGLQPALDNLEIGDPVAITYTEQKFVNDPVVLLCNLLSIRELKPGEIKHRTG